MAQIAGVVLELLSPLLSSSLGGMAEAAVFRVNSETSDDRSGRELTALEQLEIVNTVIAGSLKRELLLIGENREMLASLRNRVGGDLFGQPSTGDRSGLEINDVKVLRELPEGQYREEDLISGERLQNVLRLLRAWSAGVAEARRQLEIGDDDSR